MENGLFSAKQIAALSFFTYFSLNFQKVTHTCVTRDSIKSLKKSTCVNCTAQLIGEQARQNAHSSHPLVELAGLIWSWYLGEPGALLRAGVDQTT